MTSNTRDLLTQQVIAQRDSFEASTDLTEYLEGVLDIEVTRTLSGSLRGFALQLCAGGPSVWLEVTGGEYADFIGYSSGERVARSSRHPNAIALWDLLADIAGND